MACSNKEVVSGLTQREKIVTLSLLAGAGISATEQKSQDGKLQLYSLSVSEADYLKALNILEQLGLPKTPGRSSIDLLQNDTFVPPTPEVMALRLEIVAGDRLRELIEQLPKILNVDVLFRRQGETARATIVAQHVGDEEALRKSITELALQAYPELKADALEINLVRLAVEREKYQLESFPRPFSFRIPAAERSTATYQVFSLLGLSILAALFVGFFAGLVISGLMWGKHEKRKAERRRTGDYPILPTKTSAALPAQTDLTR